MVFQIPTFDLGTALGQGLGAGISGGLQELGQRQQQIAEAERLRQNLASLSPEQARDPIALLQATAERPDVGIALSKAYTEQEKAQGTNLRDIQKRAQEEEAELRDYQIIKDTFGDKFANLWRSAPQGGKTELVKTGMDALLRGEDLNELLRGIDSGDIQEQTTDRKERTDIPHSTEGYIPEEIPQMEKGELPKDFKYPDFTKRPAGYTPKDWREEQKGWRKENAPIFSENKKRLSNTRRDKLSTKNLDKLNKSRKLPENMGRIIIDPETGDLRTTAQLAGISTPETQQWVKEIARFQNRAKDAFGARVTNFDLLSYMKQFPNLLNTSEGRARIIDMMRINYELDELYQNALDKVYKKYGMGNIPQESADELAQRLIEKDTKRLEDEYLRVSEGIEVVTNLDTKGYKKGDRAANPQTGEIFIFDGSQWIQQQ